MPMLAATDPDPIKSALRHFKKVDPILYAAALPHAAALRAGTAAPRRPSGQAFFASLAASIAGQQLSTKAADTIWARLIEICGSVTPESITRLSETELRAAGLSAAKIRALQGLAAAIQERRLNLPALRRIPEDEAMVQLTALWGIGRWTAEMFLMFALKRPDVFSSGDLGLRRSMEALYNLPQGIHVRELEAIAARWSPHRTIASRVLWRVRDTTNTTLG